MSIELTWWAWILVAVWIYGIGALSAAGGHKFGRLGRKPRAVWNGIVAPLWPVLMMLALSFAVLRSLAGKDPAVKA